jgi:hypothetical protein
MEIAVTMYGVSGERTVRWPLRALVAWLFVGRQCDEVRALLARGETTRDGVRATWTPVHLSPEELTAIERTFPIANPERQLDLGRARAWLVTSGGETALAGDDPRARRAAAGASYRWFDYGPWADVWEARIDGEVVRFEMPREGERAPWSTAP